MNLLLQTSLTGSMTPTNLPQIRTPIGNPTNVVLSPAPKNATITQLHIHNLTILYYYGRARATSASRFSSSIAQYLPSTPETLARFPILVHVEAYVPTPGLLAGYCELKCHN